jgi:hypothetical protein
VIDSICSYDVMAYGVGLWDERVYGGRGMTRYLIMKPDVRCIRMLWHVLRSRVRVVQCK